MPIHTTTHWKRFTLIGMLVGLLGSALLPTSTTTGYAAQPVAQTTAGSSFEWNTPDGAGGSASFDDPGVYAEVDTANPRYDGLCSNRAYHITSTVTVRSGTSSVVDVTGGLIQPVGDGSYRPYPGPYYGPITSQGARILNDNSWHWWEQIIMFPFTVSTDANASARIELYVDLHGGPARYADKPYGWSEMYEEFSTVQVDYELIPVEVNAEGKVIGELPPEDATNNCGTYYEVSFYPNPLGPDALPDTGDEPIGTFGPDGLPGTDDDIPIGGGITDNPGSLRQTKGDSEWPGETECKTYDLSGPYDHEFNILGVNLPLKVSDSIRVRFRACWNDEQVWQDIDPNLPISEEIGLTIVAADGSTLFQPGTERADSRFGSGSSSTYIDSGVGLVFSPRPNASYRGVGLNADVTMTVEIIVDKGGCTRLYFEHDPVDSEGC